MRCRNCGAGIGSKTKCPYCGAVADITNVISSSTQMSFSQTSSADVYNDNINGVMIVENPISVGTGFLINEQGYALTNAHVVKWSNNIPLKVFIANTAVAAKVVRLGQAERNSLGEDLAILKLSRVPIGARALKLGDSNRICNGDTAIIIGNSLGQGICMTRGIISDRCRINEGRERVMTDAAMNPGNSGGPLFDEKGRVIGVCVEARLVPRKGTVADGMKCCVPINVAKKFLRDTGITFYEEA